MQTGTIKWYNQIKGFGFIQPDGESNDLYFHYSALDETLDNNIFEGQTVKFVKEEGPKGFRAITVCEAEALEA